MSGRLWQTWTSSFSASTGDFVMYLRLRRAAGHSWGPSLLVQLLSQVPRALFPVSCLHDGSVILAVAQRAAAGLHTSCLLALSALCMGPALLLLVSEQTHLTVCLPLQLLCGEGVCCDSRLARAQPAGAGVHSRLQWLPAAVRQLARPARRVHCGRHLRHLRGVSWTGHASRLMGAQSGAGAWQSSMQTSPHSALKGGRCPQSADTAIPGSAL